MTTPVAAATAQSTQQAAEIIRDGGLVAMPTETVYGLAADATNGKAVARIYEAKGRPSFNPLISHVTGADMAARLVEINTVAEDLISAFWPGPLTLVLPRLAACPVSQLATAGLDTIAIRAPDHPVARALIEAVDRPLAAPSANPSEQLSPTTAQHVQQGLGDRVDMILDGGPCRAGLESTVVSLAGEHPALLRPGALARDDIEAVVGPLVAPDTVIASPGMLKRHYAPKANLRLNAITPKAGEAFLAFGPNAGAATANLSESGDLVEAAANLFAMLRQLDENHDRIAVAPIPLNGLGEAINDRLSRAAQPKGA